MHARRERVLDRTFYVRCPACGGATYREFFEEQLAAARAGGPIEDRCWLCGAEDVALVVVRG